MLIRLIWILILFLMPIGSFAQLHQPTITSGATQVLPVTVNRLSFNSTVFSVDFTDNDMPAVSTFSCIFKLRLPDNSTELILVNNVGHGSGGLTITDNGGGLYTASYTYNPDDAQQIGFYDLYAEINDGFVSGIDDFTANLDELEIVEVPINSTPIVMGDATTAVPPGVERIGANSTTISALFTDLDAPGVGAFLVSFKLRFDDLSEIVLADQLPHGSGGITIIDLGSGLYEAAISWDPPDVQALGFYDLYFDVSDGSNGSVDNYQNNLDELQVYDAISNKLPGLVSDTTFTLPASVNRIGSEFTMLQSVFWDGDYPGAGAFTITFKVRDASLTETVIVNAARNGEQGLRVVNVGDSLYEAAVLWDPPESAPTGSYDLYFEVTDNNNATVIDDYTVNTGELTINSNAILGDGNLLHRTNDAAGCGGPTSACHNLEHHQGQDCLVCHQPHGTANIYLVKDTIQTPNSGSREVVFKTLGIGDPYNDPDPVPGDPNSGVMADDSDGMHTGVCEVCHTSVNHHTNDDTHAGQGHYNAQDCTGCHSHANGFGSGESGGGAGCSCHNAIFATMDSTSLLIRHVLANDDANYSPGASGMYTIKNCLSCHVDHDIFRPDINTGIGTRASNLRTDWAIDPVLGDASVLSNSDYQSSGNGGVCLSCHSGPSCQGCHSAHRAPPLKTSAIPNVHRFVPKADYDAASSGHNYSVPITFTADGSVFQANCTKCHNDDMNKQYQNSTYKISLHGSSFSRILDTTAISTPTDPLEERFCYKCHSTTSNPNGGSNQDMFGVRGMGARSLAIEAEFNKTYTHPVDGFSGIHTPIENSDLMTRHVECEDCHNPHAAAAGGTGMPNSMRDVTGVDSSGVIVQVASSSFEVCFKCHGDQNSGVEFVPREDGNTNTRLEFNPNALSYHPVTAVGKNNNVPSLLNPWTENSTMTCEDCHATDNNGSPGPHGSQYPGILRLRYDTGDNITESSTAYALCYDCHSRTSILNNVGWSEHDKHIRGERTPCSLCHDPHGIVSVGQGGGEHLISFDTRYVTGSGGRIEFLDSGNNRPTCWLTCHGENHNGWN